MSPVAAVYLHLGPRSLLVGRYFCCSLVCWQLIQRRNVGLFRYWTISNIPLFLLAAPTVWLLIYSAFSTYREIGNTNQTSRSRLRRAIIFRLAIPQVALAMLAVTNYHIQVITRLSSGYIVWYIWLAELLCRGTPGNQSWARIVVTWMVMYGIIQAALFASFLPPA